MFFDPPQAGRKRIQSTAQIPNSRIEQDAWPLDEILAFEKGFKVLIAFNSEFGFEALDQSVIEALQGIQAFKKPPEDSPGIGMPKTRKAKTLLTDHEARVYLLKNLFPIYAVLE